MSSSFGFEIPFVSLLGFELVLFEGGHSAITFDPKPEHLNTKRLPVGPKAANETTPISTD